MYVYMYVCTYVRTEDKGTRRRIEVGQVSSRSTARSTGGEGWSIARSTGVHNVHRRMPVDSPVDRLKAGCSRFGSDRPHGRPWTCVGRPAGRPTDAFSAVLYRFGFLFWLGSNPAGVS